MSLAQDLLARSRRRCALFANQAGHASAPGVSPLRRPKSPPPPEFAHRGPRRHTCCAWASLPRRWPRCASPAGEAAHTGPGEASTTCAAQTAWLCPWACRQGRPDQHRVWAKGSGPPFVTIAGPVLVKTGVPLRVKSAVFWRAERGCRLAPGRVIVALNPLPMAVCP